MPPGSPVHVAYAVHPSLPEATRGTLRATYRSLHFQSDSGEFEWLLEDVTVTLTRTGGVELTASGEPGASLRTFDLEILDDPGFVHSNSIRAQVHQLRYSQAYRGAWKGVFLFLAVFAAACFVTVGLSRWTVRHLTMTLPASWERDLGDTTFADLKGSLKFVEDTNTTERIRRIAEPILAALPSHTADFRFYVVDDPDPNAFAIPGGRVVVHTGLLRFVDRPEQLAGVLAHELAHVNQRHSMRQLLSDAGPLFALSVLTGGRQRITGTLAAGSLALVSTSFSRDLEREADDLAYDYLLSARIDPRGLGEFLEKVQGLEEGGAGGALQAWNNHPPTPERIRHLVQRWRQSRTPSEFLELPSFKP